jgi:two-component system response regulator NreC
MAVKVLLVDDHPVVRLGVRACLEAQPDFQLVGEAADGLEVAPLVERLQPDVLILDLMLPSLNGLEVTRQVTQRHPRTRVIILSIYANEAYVLQALRNGASGYLLKDSHATELVRAVRAVTAGRRYLGPPLSQRAIDAYVEKASAASLDPYDTLTTREREVLQLAAEGRTNADIGARLIISPRTVETHRTNVMSKLGLRTAADLVRYAIRRGILPLED